jgi:AAA+ superfamily predicted ATPase
MLRLLEYYPGILFLTTNSGIEQLDPAIASRITVALEYKAFDLHSRKEIWRASLARVLTNSKVTTPTEILLSDDNLTTLATRYDTINGRQIKNVVQLASIVCQYEQQLLTLECIHEVVEMTISSVSSTPNT